MTFHGREWIKISQQRLSCKLNEFSGCIARQLYNALTLFGLVLTAVTYCYLPCRLFRKITVIFDPWPRTEGHIPIKRRRDHEL